MIKALLVLAASGAAVSGCGGVPGNAVATVDGESIEKSDFTHWQNVFAKSDKKTAHDTALQLLISVRWIDGEAAQQHLTVSDADVRKSFTQQKQQSFPQDADYRKFLQSTGQTEDDLLLRVRLELLSNKLRDRVANVSNAAIADYYNSNQARFTQPETRDLRVVLTKDKAKAQQAYDALKHGASWKQVKGRNVPGLAEGTADDAFFSAPLNQLQGPVKTQDGYSVFTVTKVVPPRPQTLQEATPAIKQTLQQRALDAFVKDFTKRWRAKTQCATGYTTKDCRNG